MRHTNQLLNPVEVLLFEDEFSEDYDKAGRLIDDTNQQYRFLTDVSNVESGARYKIEQKSIDEHTVKIIHAWRFEETIWGV